MFDLRTHSVQLALSTILALPAAANEAVISCGAPNRTGGTVTVIVTVIDADGNTSEVSWPAAVPKHTGTDANEKKAADIRNAAPMGSDKITVGGTGSAVRATAKAGYTITSITFKNDKTGEIETKNVFAANVADHHGLFSVSGVASGMTEDGAPSQVLVEVAGAAALVLPYPGMPADEIEDEVALQLAAQGVSTHLAGPDDLLAGRYSSELAGDGRVLVIETVDGAGFTSGSDDATLDGDVAGLIDRSPRFRIGTSYCGPAVPNSSGASGEILAHGSAVVAAQDLVLTARDVAKNQFAYFLMSQDAGFVIPPGSKGNLCLGGTIKRFVKDVKSTGSSGLVELEIDPLDLPGPGPKTILPGETWRFQCWFRDIDAGPTSNFTDGVWIEWQ